VFDIYRWSFRYREILCWRPSEYENCIRRQSKFSSESRFELGTPPMSAWINAPKTFFVVCFPPLLAPFQGAWRGLGLEVFFRKAVLGGPSSSCLSRHVKKIQRKKQRAVWLVGS
jgi:hypothetical protein